jgi:hypothetical protein
LKLIIASIIVLSLVILFLFALFPSDISVTRVVQIGAPVTDVRKKITDLRLWKSWNEFVIHPAGGKITDTSNDQNLDSTFINIAGAELRLVGVNGDSVNTIWQRGDDSFKGHFYLKETGGQTIVEWTLQFHIKWYPWDKLASMFYDKQLGPVMEKSLLNLKEALSR